MNRTVQSEWETFEKAVVAKNAPSDQRKEMRMAFFAGASAILAMQLGIPDGPDEVGMQIIAAWLEECKQFAAKYARNAH